jgi:hydrogenase expression/formation protein HypC
MCLAVPLQVQRVLDDETAVARQGGGSITINTSLLERVAPGDYVIVHAGFAIEVLDSSEADERLALFGELDAE